MSVLVTGDSDVINFTLRYISLQPYSCDVLPIIAG